MQLPPIEIDVLDLDTRIEAAIRSPTGRVFFDTSFLTWLYCLSKSARDEFVKWTEEPIFADRLHIPTWCMHELSKHLRNGSDKVFFPQRSYVKSVRDQLERAYDFGQLLVDTEWVKGSEFADRDGYLAELKGAAEKASKLIGMLGEKASLQEVHGELLPTLNRLALRSDIFAYMNGIQATYEGRAEGRLPPGYEDRGKAKGDQTDGDDQGSTQFDGANRFGDLIVWKELLEFSKAKDAKVALLVTHDRKRDWVYAPDRIRDRQGISKSNPTDKRQRIYIAAPMLVHEAKIAAGLDDVLVVNAAQLIWVLSNKLKMQLNTLAAAVQAEPAKKRSSKPSAPAPAEERQEAQPPPPDQPAVAPEVVQEEARPAQQAPLTLRLSSLADADYVGGGNPALDAAIKDLRTHNWYSQNPAINVARLALRAGENVKFDQVFVLGRNIYQAACGTAAEAQRFMAKLPSELEDLDDVTANYLAAGMFHEVYFDSKNQLRSRPKADSIDELFVLQENPRYELAIAHVRYRIGDRMNHYIVIPRIPPINVQLQFFTTPGQPEPALLQLSCRNRELLAPGDGDFSRGLYWLLHGRVLDVARVLQAFSKYFCVPRDQVESNMETNFRLRVPEELEFIDWGPSTDVTFL